MVELNKKETTKNIINIVNKYPNVVACAVDIGVMPCTVYKWIKGEWFPSAEVLVRIADVSGLKIDEILAVEKVKI